MGVFKQFATNRKLEVEGLPVQFNANPDGTIPTIYIRRVYRESPKYQAIFERVTKAHKNQIDRQELDEVTDAQLMQRVFAEAAVVKWENMRLPVGVAGIGKGEGEETQNPDACDIDFSVENVCRIFAAIPDMWRMLAMKAGDPDSYKSGELEEMAKNS